VKPSAAENFVDSGRGSCRARRMPYDWPAPAQYALAIAIVLLSLLVRWWIEGLLVEKFRFSLTLGFLLPLVLLVRPRPFLTAALIGWIGSVYFFVPPQMSLTGVATGEALVAWLVVVAFAITAWWSRLVTEDREHRLSEADKRYYSLFNSIEEGFCVVDMIFDDKGKPVDYRLIEYNPAFERHTGLYNSIGKTVSEVAPDLEQHWFDLYGKVALTGEPAHFVDQSQALKGRWFNVYAFRFGGPRSRLVAILLSNISERKRYQQALQTSEETLSSVIECLPVGVVVADSEGRLLKLNPRALEIHGFAADDDSRSDLEDYSVQLQDMEGQIVQPEQWPLERALRGEYLRDFEARVRWPDGEERFVSYSTVPVNISEGTRKVIQVTHDTTDRKRAETALRESEERFRKMADDAPVMIWITDPDGSCTYLSQSWYEYTGQAAGEALGFGWLNAVHPDDRNESERNFLKANKEREAFRMEHRLRQHDGVYRWTIDSGKPRFGANGNFLGFIGSVIDITEHKELEETLREGDQRKDEFLAILAHELRNPLAAIRMAMAVLRKSDGEASRVTAMAEIIERQSKQLSRLIDDLLDVSRITRGKVQLKKEYIDLGSVVTEALDGVREECKTKGIRLSVELPEQPITVRADPLRIAQVFGNLFSNASKYSEGGDVRITIERVNDQAVVRVTDTGIGIPPEQLSRIFDMFMQIKEKGRTASGLGIGLALAKSIVEFHGGTIDACSEGRGKGSEFVVRLPSVDDIKIRTEEKRSASLSRESGNGVDKEPLQVFRRVLVVDDNLDALEATAIMLRMNGHEVTTAEDGIEALEAASESNPEVALLDIGMPEMDGYEVAKRMRKEPWAKDLFLVAMTGWGQKRDKRQAVEAGFDAHLTKPVDPDQLEMLLKKPGLNNESQDHDHSLESPV